MQEFEIITRIKSELEGLQPYIASHGGSIEFVSFQDQIVYVALKGTCLQCPLSFYTLTYGIERTLKQKISADIVVKVVE